MISFPFYHGVEIEFRRCCAVDRHPAGDHGGSGHGRFITSATRGGGRGVKTAKRPAGFCRSVVKFARRAVGDCVIGVLREPPGDHRRVRERADTARTVKHGRAAERKDAYICRPCDV